MALTPDQYQLVADQAAQNGVDPNLAYSMIQSESGGRQYAPDGSVLTSSSGALGATQMLPGTARDMGVDPTNPDQNLVGGVRYLGQLSRRYNGDPQLVSAAYHAGMGNVDRGNLGPATRAYVAQVTGRLPQGGSDVDPALAEALQQSGQTSGGASQDSSQPQQGQDMDPALAEALANQQQASQSPAQPSMKAGDGSVTDENTNAALNAAQTATLNGMRAKFDPNAPAGSANRPYHADTPQMVEGVPAGSWYVDPTGNLTQKPGATKSDEVLGLQTGAEKPLNNVALAVDTGLRGLGGLVGAPNWTDDLSHAMGMPGTREAIENQAANLQQKAAQGIVPGKLGQFAGELGATGLGLAAGGGIAGAAAKAVPTLAPVVSAFSSGLPGAIVGGMAGGGLDTSGRDPLSIAKDMAVGGLEGSALHGLVRGAGNFLAPQITPQAQSLVDQGIYLTPGGKFGGIAKSLEDRVTSLPTFFVGDAVQAAKKASLQSFNRGAYNQALAPIGESLPDSVNVGHEAVAHAQQAIGSAYDRVLPHVSLAGDQPLALAMSDIRANQLSALPQQHGDQFQAIIRDNIVPRIGPNGAMDGQSFKLADSNIGRLATQYSRDPDTNNRMLGHALSDAQGALRDALTRQNPSYAPQLDAANSSWAAFSRLRQAASSLGSDEGVFTPKALLNSVRAGDKSVGHGVFARGDALMQDYADAGAKTVPDTLPNSGTANRMKLTIPDLIGGGLTSLPILPFVPGYGTATGRAIMDHAMFGSAGAPLDAVGRFLATQPKVSGMFGAMAPAIIDQRDQPPQDSMFTLAPGQPIVLPKR